MYICTMQFGPVMSPRLPVRVRLLPGQFSNWTVLVFPGGVENDRIRTLGRFNLVVRYMKFCCGSLCMYVVQASDIHICICSTYHTSMYAETARTEKTSNYEIVVGRFLDMSVCRSIGIYEILMWVDLYMSCAGERYTKTL